jgi:hypothetical protein
MVVASNTGISSPRFLDLVVISQCRQPDVDRRSAMKLSTSQLKAAIIALAFVPWLLVLTASGWGWLSALVVAITWSMLAVAYYRRVKPTRPSWIFVLVAVAFAPFIL